MAEEPGVAPEGTGPEGKGGAPGAPLTTMLSVTAAAMKVSALQRAKLRFASLEERAKSAAARRQRDPLRAGLGGGLAGRSGAWGSVVKKSADMLVGRYAAKEKERRIAEGAFEMEVAVAGRPSLTLLSFSGDERRADIFAIARRRLLAEIEWDRPGNPRFGEFRLPDHFGSARITNSDELRAVLSEYDELASERLVDLRRAHVARIRAGLLLQGEKAELAAHGAWELACRVDNHDSLIDVLPLLLAGLGSPYSRTLRKRCAATLAMFAETEMAMDGDGVNDLPIEELVRMLHAHFLDFIERERGERSEAAKRAEAAAAAEVEREATELLGGGGTEGAAEAEAAAAGGRVDAAAEAAPSAAEASEQASTLASLLQPTAEEAEALVDDPVVPDELDEMLLLLAILLSLPQAQAEHARLDGDAHVLELLELPAQDVRRCAVAVLSTSFRHSAAACVGFVSDGGCGPLLALAEDQSASQAVRASAASALGWALRFCRHASAHELLASRVEPALLDRLAALMLSLQVGCDVVTVARQGPPARTGRRRVSKSAPNVALAAKAASAKGRGRASASKAAATAGRAPRAASVASAAGVEAASGAEGAGGAAAVPARRAPVVARAFSSASGSERAPSGRRPRRGSASISAPLGAASAPIGAGKEGSPSFVDVSLLEAALCAAWAIAAIHRGRAKPLLAPSGDAFIDWLLDCMRAGTHFPPKHVEVAAPAAAAPAASAAAGAPAAEVAVAAAKGKKPPLAAAAAVASARPAPQQPPAGSAESSNELAAASAPASAPLVAEHGSAPAGAPAAELAAAPAAAPAAAAEPDPESESEIRWTYRLSQMAAATLSNMRPAETSLPLLSTALSVVELALRLHMPTAVQMAHARADGDASGLAGPDAPADGEQSGGGGDPLLKQAEPTGGGARMHAGGRVTVTILALDEHWSRLADGSAALLAQWALQPHQHGLLGEAGAPDRLAALLLALEQATARALGGAPRAPPERSVESMLYRNLASALACIMALPALVTPPPAERVHVIVGVAGDEEEARPKRGRRSSDMRSTAESGVQLSAEELERAAAAAAEARRAAEEAEREARAIAHALRPPRAHVWRGEPTAEAMHALSRLLLDPEDGSCAYGACALWAIVRSDARADLAKACAVVDRLLGVLRRHARGATGQAPVSAWATLCANWSAWALCACAHFKPSACALADTPDGLALLCQLAGAQEASAATGAAPRARPHGRVDVRVRAAATLSLAALCCHYATAPVAVGAGVHALLAEIGADGARETRERRAAARALCALRLDGRFKEALGDKEERALVTMVGATDRPELRRLGARALARIALGQRRRLILELGGTAALLQAVRDSAAAHAHDEAAEARGEAPLDAAARELEVAAAQLLAAEQAMAEVLPAHFLSDEEVSARQAVETAEARQQAAQAQLDLRELLPEALGALVNLSAEVETQKWLGKHALWTLTRLLDTPPAGCVPAARLSAQVLSHVASNRSNRRRMYRAELKLKAKRWVEDAQALEAMARQANAAVAGLHPYGAGWASGSDDSGGEWEPAEQTHPRPRAIAEFDRWLDSINERTASGNSPFASRPSIARHAKNVSGSGDGLHRTLHEVMCTSFEHMWLEWHAIAIDDDTQPLRPASLGANGHALDEEEAHARFAGGSSMAYGSAVGARPSTAAKAAGARVGAAERRPATAAGGASSRFGSASLASLGLQTASVASRPPSGTGARPSTSQSRALNRSAHSRPQTPSMGSGLLLPVRFASAQRPPSAFSAYSHASRASAGSRLTAISFSASSSMLSASSAAASLRTSSLPAERWFPDIQSIHRHDEAGRHSSHAAAQPSSRHPRRASAPPQVLILDPVAVAKPKPSRRRATTEAPREASSGGALLAAAKASEPAGQAANPLATDAPRRTTEYSVVMAMDSRQHLKPIWTFSKSERVLPPPSILTDPELAAKIVEAAGQRPVVESQPEAEDPRFQMAQWKANPGARYWRLHGSAAEAPSANDAPFGQFELPGGELVRCYHTGVKRHAYDPPEESADLAFNMPFLRLSDVGDNVPPPPRPPFPSEHSKPPLRTHVHIAAPMPEEHTIPNARPDAWYGTLWPEPVLLMAVPFRPPADELHDYELLAWQKPPWSLDTSIYAPRKRTCDARAYYTTSVVLKRGFALDWERCNSARFQRLVSIEDDGGALGLVEELSEVREALESNCAFLYSVFTYYCLCGAAYDNHVIGMNEYTLFLEECGIPEPTSRFCRKADLDTIFIAACPKDDEGAAKLHLERALMRYQWLQVIVRIAIAKYIRTGRCDDVSEALEMLISRDILPNISSYAGHDHDVFRQEQLYKEETEIVSACIAARL